MKLYIVYGAKSDGSQIGVYGEFCIVSAPFEDVARRVPSDGLLLGDRKKWGIVEIGESEIYNSPRVIEVAYMRD